MFHQTLRWFSVYTHTHTHTQTEGAANRGRHSHDNGPHVSTSGDRVTATSYGPPQTTAIKCQPIAHSNSFNFSTKCFHSVQKRDTESFVESAESSGGIFCRLRAGGRGIKKGSEPPHTPRGQDDHHLLLGVIIFNRGSGSTQKDSSRSRHNDNQRPKRRR